MTSEVAEASLGELVSVHVESQSQTLLLDGRVDEGGGGLRWDVISGSAQGIESKENLAAHLRTKTWMAPMLRDTERNHKYAEAIARAVQQICRERDEASSGVYENGPPGSLVLEIGAGTGLLSMMAARAGASHVIAVEMFPAVSSLAQTITSHPKNSKQYSPGCELKVITAHSSTLSVAPTMTASSVHRPHSETTLPRRADCLLSELLDSTLLGEGILPTVRDAWQRLLRPGATVVPSRARLWAQVVSCPSLRRDFADTVLVAGGSVVENGRHRCVRFSRRSEVGEEHKERDAFYCGGSGSTFPVRVQSLPGFADHRRDGASRGGDDRRPKKRSRSATNTPNGNFQPLTRPFVAFDFDFSALELLPPAEGRQRFLPEILVTASGTADAVVFWWDLTLWREESEMSSAHEGVGEDIVYSTNPYDEALYFQDHWMHSAYPLPPIRMTNDDSTHVRGNQVQVGDFLSLSLGHDETCVWVSSVGASEIAATATKTTTTGARVVVPVIKPVCSCGLHLLYEDCERSAVLCTGTQRHRVLAEGLQLALQSLESPPPQYRNCRPKPRAATTILEVSDGSALAVVAAALGAGSVLSIEERTLSMHLWSQIVDAQEEATKCLAASFRREVFEPSMKEKHADCKVGAPAGSEQIEERSAEVSILLARPDQIERGAPSTPDNDASSTTPEPFIDVVAFDGYARGLEKHPIAAALHFFHVCCMLASKRMACFAHESDSSTGVPARNHGEVPTRTVPRSARIMASVVSSQQLCASYGLMGACRENDYSDTSVPENDETICGFYHGPLNEALRSVFGWDESTDASYKLEIDDHQAEMAREDHKSSSSSSSSPPPLLSRGINLMMCEFFDVHEIVRAPLATLDFQNLRFLAEGSRHNCVHTNAPTPSKTADATETNRLTSTVRVDLPPHPKRPDAVVFWVEYDVGESDSAAASLDGRRTGQCFATGPLTRGFRQLVQLLPPPGDARHDVKALEVTVDLSGGLVQVSARLSDAPAQGP